MRLRQTSRLRPGAVLAPVGDDMYAVYPDGDRRRRAVFALPGETVETLRVEGVLEPLPHGAFRRKAEEPPNDPATTSAIHRLAALAGPAGPAWFGGRAIAAAERLWRGGEVSSLLPDALHSALEAFRGTEISLARLERAQQWPPGAGRVALKLALELLDTERPA